MKTGRLIPILIAAFVMVASAGLGPDPASGAVRAVPQSYPSIQSAINSAASGDTIQISSGTYSEKLYVIGRSNLVIEGAGKDQSRIVNVYSQSDDAPSIYVESSNNITVRGIGFEGGDTGIVVTRDSDVSVEDSSLTGFVNVGIFIGQIPCAPLPPGSLAVPECYTLDREAYVDGSHLDFINSDVVINGVNGVSGTGLVFFAGTSGLVQNSVINRNKLTGVFVWGASVDIDGCTFDRNVEHAIEYRQYPSPKMKKGFIQKAEGTLTQNVIQSTLPLPGNYLGGGMVLQAAEITLRNNTIDDNAAWGISASNRSSLTLSDNTITNNGHAGLIIQKKSRAVLQTGDVLSGNSYEGVIALSGSFVETNQTTVQNNGRYGVLFQKRSQGHVVSSLISGNGVSGGDYGGVAFAAKSWGSVVGSQISNHNNGAGIIYFGSPKELFVEDNVISSNKSSGVVFSGVSGLGTVMRNVISLNQPKGVSCPNGGSPYFGEPDENQFSGNGQNIDGACGTPPGQFITVPRNTALQLTSSDRVGYRNFANIISSSLPMAAGRTMTGQDGVTRVTAASRIAKKWYFPGGSTASGNNTRITLFNPGVRAVTANVILYPEGGSPKTVTRRIRRKKKKVLNAAAILGPGFSFSTMIAGSKALVAEQEVITSTGAAAAPGTNSSTSWYFAGGESEAGLDTLVSFHNPGSVNASLTFTYLLGPGSTATSYHQVNAGGGASFSAAADLGAYEGPYALLVSSDYPVFASLRSSNASGTTGDIGAISPSESWYLPGGTTRDGAETYIHLANPGESALSADLSFQWGDPGTESIFPINLSAGEVMTIRGSDYVGAGCDFGLEISAQEPIIAGERTTYAVSGASSDPGVSEPGYLVYLADGGASDTKETYLHLFNPNSDPLSVRLIYRFSR